MAFWMWFSHPSTHMDERKKKTRRFPDLPAADMLGIGYIGLASRLPPWPASCSCNNDAGKTSSSESSPGRASLWNGAEAAWLGAALRPP